MLYQSSILSASPLTSLAIDPSYPRMATGSGDGVVRFFDLSSLPACRCLQVVDVAKQIQKIADKAASIASSSCQGEGDGPIVISSGRKAGSQQVCGSAASGTRNMYVHRVKRGQD